MTADIVESLVIPITVTKCLSALGIRVCDFEVLSSQNNEIVEDVAA